MAVSNTVQKIRDDHMTITDDGVVNLTFHSLQEATDVAEKMLDSGDRHTSSTNETFADRRDWSGNVTAHEAFDLATYGWQEGGEKGDGVARDALSLIEGEVEDMTFTQSWDVAGSEVDVGAYCLGTPECMIEYEPVTISRAGRVISLVASVCYSGGIHTDTIMNRGAYVTGLAQALQRTGHEVELWAYIPVRSREGGKQAQVRVLVKGTKDVVDPSRIAWAFSHPSSLRVVGFLLMGAFPKDYQWPGYGSPADPQHDQPEGTIYLPSLSSDSSRNESQHQAMLKILQDLGLVREDANPEDLR